MEEEKESGKQCKKKMLVRRKTRRGYFPGGQVTPGVSDAAGSLGKLETDN